MSKTGITVSLIGQDGNAFSILGATKKAMQRAGISKEVIDQYMIDAQSGDYHHLLHVTSQYVDIK